MLQVSQNSPYSSQKQLCVGDLVVNNKYTILNSLHQGPNSKIFTVAFMKNNKQVTRVLKTQTNTNVIVGHTKKNINIGIKNEVNVLRGLFINQYGKLDLKVGFPHMFQFGTEGDNNYIVQDLYGPNLFQLLKLCAGKFSARTTLLIALQIMDRLEQIHNKKYLYAGMSPQNFVIGLSRESYLIYMLDFSRSMIYKSKNKGTHIPYQQSAAFSNGDQSFTSVNCQLNIQISRRDDLQSLMYLIVYMFKGRLPWIGGEGNSSKNINDRNKMVNQNKDDKRKGNVLPPNLSSLTLIGLHSSMQQEYNGKILEIKRRISVQSLLKSMSFELIDMMYYIKTLSFYEKPDYTFLRKKLWSALMETDYEQLRNNIIIYDWNQREPLDYEIYRESPKFKLKIDEEKDEIVEESASGIQVRQGSTNGRSGDNNLKNSGHSAELKPGSGKVMSSAKLRKITSITTGSSAPMINSCNNNADNYKQKSQFYEQSPPNGGNQHKQPQSDDANVILSDQQCEQNQSNQDKGSDRPSANKIQQKLKRLKSMEMVQGKLILDPKMKTSGQKNANTNAKANKANKQSSINKQVNKNQRNEQLKNLI